MDGATIYDIAQKAGVAPSTVSRALQDHPRIGAKTRQRIQSLADEMGYVPSAVARGLKTSRSHVIGVIVHRIEDPFLTEVLRGIEDTLQASGYSLFLAASQRDLKREEKAVQAMGENRVDGVIISSSDISSERMHQLERYGIPSVLINNQTQQAPHTYSVYHDERYAMHQLLHHVIELGHERIAYLGNTRGGRTNLQRRQGYEEALAQAGLKIRADYIVNGENGMPQSGAQSMRALLESATALIPTAVVCFNDMMALGAMQAIRQAGLRVPDDLSLTGFDNVDLAAYFNPPLTTFHQPRYELGLQAATMMLQALNGEIGPAEQASCLRGELIVRQSTGPHPAAPP
ncbi:MAG: LacI family DNA-binding transcriptional regulator [Caldilineaceae bacterium]|nr:LacI family DNA-binding transcriptional regulator [Caldilineaceae bacterium]